MRYDQLMEGMRNLSGRTYPFVESHAHVAKNLRRYSAASVAELVLAQMRRAPTTGPSALKGTPWLSMVLLKWALLEPQVRLQGGDAMPPKVYDALRQRLWDTSDAHVLGPGGNPHLMMRRIMHAQMGFQASDTKYLLLWPTLMLGTAPGSSLHNRFREAMRMEPAQFLDLAIALFAALQAGKGVVAANFFDALRPAYGILIDEMLALFAQDLQGLRAALQADPAQSQRSRDELSEFPFTQRYPLVKLQAGGVAWWHPKVFARGLEMAIHERLSGFSQAYVDPFSRLFEQWVMAGVTASGVPCIAEDQYKRTMGSGSRAVEAIVRPGAGCNVLVEAKMGLFPEAVLISDSERVVYEKMKRVRAAIAQAADVAASLLDPSHPFHDPACDTNYALIVTSRELNVLDGTGLQQLFPSREIGFNSEAAARALPLAHVLIVSAQEFDRLFGVVRVGKLDLAATLQEAVHRNASPVTRRMYLSQHYDGRVSRLEVPHTIDTAMRGAAQRLTGHLGLPPDMVASKLAQFAGTRLQA